MGGLLLEFFEVQLVKSLCLLSLQFELYFSLFLLFFVDELHDIVALVRGVSGVLVVNFLCAMGSTILALAIRGVWLATFSSCLKSNSSVVVDCCTGLVGVEIADISVSGGEMVVVGEYADAADIIVEKLEVGFGEVISLRRVIGVLFRSGLIG